MELRHLRYFVTVAEEENVTRAAARLHVSQPPLTRQIHDLEEELGVQLFRRTGKSIRLTDAGRLFLIEAKAALLRVDEAVQAVRTLVHGKMGQFNLGYAPSPTVSILPSVLRAFREQFPAVKVNLYDCSSTQMINGLHDGTLHAALMVEPILRCAQGIAFETLRTYPFVVAVAPGHPFTKKGSVKLQEVLAEPVVVYSRAEYPDYHELLARAIGVKTRRLHIVEECDSGMSLIAAVESGRGIAVSSASIADTAGQRLEYVPLAPASSKAVVVGLGYRKQGLSENVKLFIQAIREAANPLLATVPSRKGLGQRKERKFDSTTG